MAKEESFKSFKVDDATNEKLGKLAVELDCSLSKIVKTAILLGVAAVEDDRALLDRDDSSRGQVHLKVRMTEDFSDWLGRKILEFDCTLSTIIRVSLRHSVSQIRKFPVLLNILSLEVMSRQ